MREYKFRGKARISTEQLDEIGFKHDNGWIYGTYIDGYIINGVEEASGDYIAISNWCPVIPETVGQYTGIKDSEGIEICEGDNIGNETTHILQVVYDKGHPSIKFTDMGTEHIEPITQEEIDEELLIVTGNIHEERV